MVEYLKWIRNIRHALNGIRAILCEKNIRIFLLVWSVLTIVLFVRKTDSLRMYFFYGSFLLLIVLEMINSAIERLADFVCKGEYRPEIGLIKDISSGAIFIIGFVSILIRSSIWIW